MANDTEYRLYASIIQDVPAGIKYSCIAPNSKHLLIYSDSKPQGQMPFVEITANVKLSKEEERWLKDCKSDIAFLKEQKEQEKAIKEFNAFLDRCNDEIQKEKSKIEKNKGANKVKRNVTAARKTQKSTKANGRQNESATS